MNYQIDPVIELSTIMEAHDLLEKIVSGPIPLGRMRPTEPHDSLVISSLKSHCLHRDASPKSHRSCSLYLARHPFIGRHYHSSLPTHDTYLWLHYNRRCVITVGDSGFDECILNTSRDRWTGCRESANGRSKNHCTSFGGWREVSGSKTVIIVQRFWVFPLSVIKESLLLLRLSLDQL